MHAENFGRVWGERSWVHAIREQRDALTSTNAIDGRKSWVDPPPSLR